MPDDIAMDTIACACFQEEAAQAIPDKSFGNASDVQQVAGVLLALGGVAGAILHGGWPVAFTVLGLAGVAVGIFLVDLQEPEAAGCGCALAVAGAVGLIFSLVGVAGVGAPLALWLLPVLAGAFIARGAPGVARRRHVDRRLREYAEGLPDAVARVHEFALAEFRRRIGEHRERTLGVASQWGKARASVADAVDEAERSLAYWTERLHHDPANELVGAQGRVAVRVTDKLRRAQARLDAQAEALRRFYNDCDAKLAIMDRSNRDLEEASRLGALADRADAVVAEAEGTIEGLARDFMAEAHAIAAALGGAAELGIKSLAGEASEENLEFLADAVIANSEREQSMVEQLERSLLA